MIPHYQNNHYIFTPQRAVEFFIINVQGIKKILRYLKV